MSCLLSDAVAFVLETPSPVIALHDYQQAMVDEADARYQRFIEARPTMQTRWDDLPQQHGSLSNVDHLVISRILEFPRCCAINWVFPTRNDRGDNGGFTEYHRSAQESAAMYLDISLYLGWQWGRGLNEEKRYVPCDCCAHRLHTQGVNLVSRRPDLRHVAVWA